MTASESVNSLGIIRLASALADPTWALAENDTTATISDKVNRTIFYFSFLINSLIYFFRMVFEKHLSVVKTSNTLPKIIKMTNLDHVFARVVTK
jgi:hypothetical protein